MGKRIDLTGKRFGRLIVTAYAQHWKWASVCDCGGRAVVRGDNLRYGRTKSCGCLMGWRRIDLTGKRFGRWRVLAYAGRSRWFCRCDCGVRGDVDGQSLRDGSSKSCGCLSRELVKARGTKHGMYGSPEYRSWISMKGRCLNPRHVYYENYGGRGISVYKEWLSFEAFFADMGTRPEGCSLDRIDPDGNYEPGNVRWANSKQQIQNRRPQRSRAAVKRRQRKRAERLPPPLDDPPF